MTMIPAAASCGVTMPGCGTDSCGITMPGNVVAAGGADSCGIATPGGAKPVPGMPVAAAVITPGIPNAAAPKLAPNCAYKRQPL